MCAGSKREPLVPPWVPATRPVPSLFSILLRMKEGSHTGDLFIQQPSTAPRDFQRPSYPPTGGAGLPFPCLLLPSAGHSGKCSREKGFLFQSREAFLSLGEKFIANFISLLARTRSLADPALE